MVEQAGDERVFHAILKGRLVLALVSARAERCPRKTCGRLRRCAARFGQVGSNFHTRIGDCPNMSEAEWRAVSLGMQMNVRLLEPWFKAREAARAAATAPEREKLWRLPAEERERRWNAPEAVAERAAAERRRLALPREEFRLLLWRELRGEDLVVPRDLPAAEGRLCRRMRECGCRCAVEGRSDGCGEGARRCEAMANGK